MPNKSDPRSIAGRPKDKERLLGQVLTPKNIAEKMAIELLKGRPKTPISILDPSVGPGTFLNALFDLKLISKHDLITMFDIDENMIKLTKECLDNKTINNKLKCDDYLESKNVDKFDYAILNPPYIRQEWLDNKRKYRKIFKEEYGIDIPGTSNIYVYFLVKILYELNIGAKFACIIYDSWQYTKYGKWLYSLICSNCDKVETISVGSQPFDGRLIDATIIYGIRNQLNFNPKVEFEDNNLSEKEGLYCNFEGFNSIEKLFYTKRGLRLKQANFFLCKYNEYKTIGATPFVKKPSKIKGYFVPEYHDEAALLIKSKSENQKIFNELLNRISKALDEPEKNISIITWYRERPDNWPTHREAPYAPILFNYYIRGRPKHIFNSDRAYADNFYGLTPKNDIHPLALLALMNSTYVCNEILYHSRNQGNGLKKIQLFEYRNVFVPDWSKFSTKTIQELEYKGKDLINNNPNTSSEIIPAIDELIAYEFPDNILDSSKVVEQFEKLLKNKY